MSIKEVVKEKYGQAALRVSGGGSSCCGATPGSGCCDPITSNLYDSSQAQQIPEEALLASLGCGNPTSSAMASLCQALPWLAMASSRVHQAIARSPRSGSRRKPDISAV